MKNEFDANVKLCEWLNKQTPLRYTATADGAIMRCAPHPQLPETHWDWEVWHMWFSRSVDSLDALCKSMSFDQRWAVAKHLAGATKGQRSRLNALNAQELVFPTPARKFEAVLLVLGLT